MRACVTGATGFIGRNLVEHLIRGGYEVTVLTRRDNHGLPSEVNVVKGDLINPEAPLEKFLEGCEVLFHCAGEIHQISLMKELHIEGTKSLVAAALLECARTNRKMHWVQLSSVGAYGPPVGKLSAPRVVTEKSPIRPDNEYELTKTLSDDWLIKACADGPISYTILRPSNVFGDTYLNRPLNRLINLIEKQLFVYVADEDGVITFVHVADVVAALIACSVDVRAKGEIYNISSDCSLKTLVGEISLVLGVKTPRLKLPIEFVNRALILMSRFFRKWVRIPTLNVLLLNTRYPSSKLERELGFKFSKPLPHAIVQDIKLNITKSKT
jgi:nucleoside-diphosphate-sugar epimerase